MAGSLEDIIADMPDEIHIVADIGYPFTGDGIVVQLDDEIKTNLAHIMLDTGEDFDTAVINTLKLGLESGL